MKHASKRMWGEFPDQHLDSLELRSESVRDGQRTFISWVGQNHLCTYRPKYCLWLPSSRSTIAAAFSSDGRTLASTHLKKEDKKKKEDAARNSPLQLAALEQQKADVNLLKLDEDQKRQKEELHNRIFQLEKQLDAKQALELETEGLRGSLNVIKHTGDDCDVEILKKMDAIIHNLREKEGELEDLEALNQALIVRERKSNDELQEALKN